MRINKKIRCPQCGTVLTYIVEDGKVVTEEDGFHVVKCYHCDKDITLDTLNGKEPKYQKPAASKGLRHSWLHFLLTAIFGGAIYGILQGQGVFDKLLRNLPQDGSDPSAALAGVVAMIFPLVCLGAIYLICWPFLPKAPKEDGDQDATA